MPQGPGNQGRHQLHQWKAHGDREMYRAFFELRDHPFRPSPDPRFFYMTPQVRESLACLQHDIASGRRLLSPTEAAQLIYLYSRGDPHLIDLLCEHALINASVEQAITISLLIVGSIGNEPGFSEAPEPSAESAAALPEAALPPGGIGHAAPVDEAVGIAKDTES